MSAPTVSYGLSPQEFFHQAALRNVPGVTPIVIRGHNDDIATSPELIWEQGGLYTYLSANTELYISSSNAGDTQSVQITYIDDQFVQKTATATLAGQSQVSIATDVFRIFNTTNLSSTDFAGEIYVAESDTLTGGVPDTVAKIKDKVGFINGSLSRNNSLSSLYTVPAGKTLIIHHFYVATDKGEDLTSTFRFRIESIGVFNSVADAHVFESSLTLPTFGVFRMPEKTDIEVVAQAGTGTAQADTATYGLLVDN